MPAEGNIIIRRAKVNNLKDITVEIPRNRLVVVTGISGSGKSSLAFDTLFAEGQRRFAESLSSYARQFLGRMSKPDVEMIEGIPPAIAIEQKVNIRNPRSTVATTTEIYDFLRLLYARIGRTYSPVSGQEVRAHTVQDVLQAIFDGEAHTVYILSDVRWKDRKDKVELMLQLKEEGYGRFFDLDTQEVLRIEDVMQMDGHYPENLHLLVDRAKTKQISPLASLGRNDNEDCHFERSPEGGVEKSLKLIAYCFEGDTKRISIQEALKAYEGNDITILIGPEGDFSPEEARLAIDQGYIPVHLGASRLRTETAAVLAATAVYLRFE